MVEDNFSLLRLLMEMQKDPANQLDRLHQDLTAVGVQYAYIGGLALRPHNFSRMTNDIDVLVSKETLSNLKQLHGLGYTVRPGSTNNMYLHAGGFAINVDILVEGQKEGGFVLPDPVKVRQKIHGVWYVTLLGLITLKLQASRPQDIADVHRLIDANELTIEYAKNLPAHVRNVFISLFKEKIV